MSNSASESRHFDPRMGYGFACLNAVISGFAIYVSSLGAKLFASAALYTTLKNMVVGIALLLPLLLFAKRRAEWKRLSKAQWGRLLLLAVIGGSVPYVLFFTGLKMSSPVTSSLLNHTQFVLVATLGFFLLRERAGFIVWLALAVLFIGTVWGTTLVGLHWGMGDTLVALSTILFAGGVVLAKYLLQGLSTLTVMTAKMSIGALLLVIYITLTGQAGEIFKLSPAQWKFALLTGLILLVFTVTAFLALRYASATVATAIPAAAPLITTALVVIAPQAGLKPSPAFGLVLMAVAVLILAIIGGQRELRAWRASNQQQSKQVQAVVTV
jgi:drug/metabolite transporter (DMT)-like permease